MRFGDYLKARRAELEWTQPEAAAKAGIEQSYLSKLEAGKSIPSAQVYQRLVEAFGIDTDKMATILFPAELDRLREIGAVRDILLRQYRDSRALSRRWLLAGLALLVIGGGLAGLSRLDDGGIDKTYAYQSIGLIRPGEGLDVYDGMDARVDADAPDQEARRTEREALVARADYQTRSVTEFRGPGFVEAEPGGRRVWSLVGQTETPRASRYWWAGVPAWSLILGGLGCFFISWRWPRGGGAAAR